MKLSLALPVVAALVVAFCLQVHAQTKWGALDDVRTQSAAADKPIFVLVVSQGPQRQDPWLAQVRKQAESDKDAIVFMTATVNLYLEYSPTAEEKARGHLNYRKNLELVPIYGDVSGCAVIAPGALRPLWKLKEGAKSGDLFKQARKAYEDWRRGVDALAKELKQDREKRKDPAVHLKLGEAWSSGHAVTQAGKCFDDALKLLTPGEKSGARGEEITMRAACIALEGLDYIEAAKRFKGFVETYKDSARCADAHLGRAQALLGANDLNGAIKELDQIDTGATEDVRKRAQEVRSEIERKQAPK